jgi:hypothetical protein
MTNMKQKVALMLMALFATGMLLLALGLRFKDPTDNGRADFMQFYVAGRILNEGPRSQLYNEDLQVSLREHLFGPKVPIDLYIHPPFEALIFSPLARLSYPAAFVLWDIANLFLVGAFLSLIKPFAPNFDTDCRLLLVLALLYPLISTFGEGQDSILLLFLYVSAFINLKKGRDFWAGSALGASLFRFQLAIPFLLVFLIRKRWRVVLSASMVGALLGGVSLALVGWAGMFSYARLLLTRERTYTAMAQLPTVRGFLEALLAGRVNERVGTVLVALVSVGLLAWLLLKWRGVPWDPSAKTFDLLFSLSLVVAFMLSFHSLIHTMVVLALPMVLFLDHWAALPMMSIGRWLAVAPLILLFVMAVMLSEVTINSFAYLFPAILLLAFAISGEISSLERTPPARPELAVALDP